MDQATETVAAEVLKKFEPINRLDEVQIDELARATSLLKVEAGTRIVKRGSRDPWTFYLVDGSLQMTAEDGSSAVITSDSDEARSAVARAQPREYDVVAASAATLARMETSALLLGAPSGLSTDYLVNELSPGSDERQAALCLAILADIEAHKLKLPSMPEQALKIRELTERSQANATKLANALVHDVAITAKLIRAANSALYTGASPVGSCGQAIVRLGIKTTAQLVLSFAMRELFDFRSPTFQARAERLWEHSTEVAATACALARRLPDLDAERALLAGLLHDIGVTCILTYAEREPTYLEDEAGLEATIELLRGEIGGLILRNWNFPDDLVLAASGADDWARNSRKGPDYCDLVIAAQVLVSVSSTGKRPVARLDAVPALRKLIDAEVSPESVLELLHSLRDDVAELREIFQR